MRLYGRETPLKPRRLPWQESALQAWERAGRRGIIEAATGTGKTLIALAAMDRLDKEGELRTCIVVPRIALQQQWEQALCRYFGMDPRDIGAIGGGILYTSGEAVVVAVINSARTQLAPLMQNWKTLGYETLLVVDECHWSGSEKNSNIFDVPASYTLGLSATPERNDDGLDEYTIPGLGEVVYHYPLLQALDDEILAPLKVVNFYVDFDPREAHDYREVSDRITKLIHVLEGEYPRLARAGKRWHSVLEQIAETDIKADDLKKAILQRRRLVCGAKARALLFEDLASAPKIPTSKSIIFHETIETAEQSCSLLMRQGYEVAIDHSALRPTESSESHEKFRTMKSGAFVVVRKVDEGIDVPDADVAVIYSGTLTPRQRIQRLGRILRRSGKTALCISILVRGTSEETRVGAADAGLVGEARVSHYHWPTASVEEALAGDPSDFRPRAHLPPELITPLDRQFGGTTPEQDRENSDHPRCVICGGDISSEGLIKHLLLHHKAAYCSTCSRIVRLQAFPEHKRLHDGSRGPRSH